MSTNIEEALANCLERVESGEISPQEALGLYPELRAELEPLLALTAELRAMPKVDAPARLRGYKRPVFRVAPARESWWRRLLPAGGPSLGWATPVAQVAAVVAVVVFAGGGTMVAAASSLPDEPLYPVKLAVENAQLALAQNDHARAQLELQLASKRLAEVESAAQQGRSDAVAKGLELYQQNADAAAKASEATSSPGDSEQVQDSLRQNVEALRQVQQKMIDQKVGNERAQAAISDAIARSLAASNDSKGKDKANGQAGKPTPESTATATPVPTAAASSSVSNPTATPAVPPQNPAGHVPPGQARGLSEATASPVPGSGASSSATNPTATPTAVAQSENPAGHEPPGKAKGPSDEPGNSGQGNPQGNPQSQEPKGQGQKQQVLVTPESSPAPAVVTHTPTPTPPGNKAEAPGANRGNGQDKPGNGPITNGSDKQLKSDTEQGNSKKDFVSTIVESIRNMIGRR